MTVQWLGLHAYTAGSMGSVGEIRSSMAHSQKVNKYAVSFNITNNLVKQVPHKKEKNGHKIILKILI